MKKSTRIGWLTLMALVLCGIRPAMATDKWVSVRSQNFLFVGDASESQIRRIARELEESRATFAMLFPNAGKKSAAGTTVIVFKNDAAFKPFKPLYEGKPSTQPNIFSRVPT